MQEMFGDRSKSLKRKLNDITNPNTGKTVSTNDKKSEELSCSLLTNLSQYFKDALVENEEDIFDSEDIFAETYDDGNMETNIEVEEKLHIPSVMQSISADKKKLDTCQFTTNKNINESKKSKKCDEQFSDLKDMYDKNIEKNVLNETSKITDISHIGESSQYRKEIIKAFDVCEMTISHLNDDFFNDANNSTFMKNDSVWDRFDVQNTEDSKVDKSFADHLPQNISKLLSGEINNENIPINDNSSIANLSLASVKTKKTPLDINEFSKDFYGLPPLTKSLIEQHKGITNFYDWQKECLTLPAILNRDNLIYALPTSGGKTLVAEILMLREVICRKKNVIFILPFVSIVQEKVWGLSPFAVSLNFLVEEYAAGKGVFPPRKRRNKKSIYIATLEKGLSLVRSLWENGRLNEIGLIVVDELHLVGEPTRGCSLEMLLTNVMFSQEDIQIVGMSATIGNIDELAKFLNAYVFKKDFRPVELKEYIKLNDTIYKIDWSANNIEEKTVFERKVNYGYSSQIEKIDPDHLGGLVMEVIPEGSCLIFCPSKKNCESVAMLLCKVIFKKLLEYRAEEKASLIKALKSEGGAEDNILLSLIPWGISYHHSGLSSEERRLIEDSFRAGIISVICCTSTLAAGVNLPAQRVILRAPMVGRNFMSISTYKQMVGRAGRAGLTGYGDSILICQPNQKAKLKDLINSPMDNAISHLRGNDESNIRNFILGAIASETATTRKKLRLLVKSSLLAVQAERMKVDINQLLDKALEALLKHSAIDTKSKLASNDKTSLKKSSEKLNNLDSSKSVASKMITIKNDTVFVVSRLGKAAVKGGIDLQRAHLLYSDLTSAQKSFVVVGSLHLLYLVTPYDLAEMIKPNLLIYHSFFTNMNTEIEHTSKVLGFTESICIQMAMGKIPKNIPERVFKRFYIAFMLYKLWNQESLYSVSEKFEIDKGFVQNLMTGVVTFASSVLRFCEELDEFWAFRDILKCFNQRLSHFCTVELVPLMDLPSVKKSRAMQLYKAGFKTLQAIAQAKPQDLVESIDHLNNKVASQMISAAKLLLLEKVENLREEAEEVIDGLL